ncbi:unnamed protein product [Adineta ricciae]|uniref:Eukaryotic translation initiation factor 3 30 kDa subunit n=1 Tax=Adineta ricciae TaxID=249248 RepID=A0A814V3Z1_ADIRI|nr:unnamed protein product [Adineta ricciae]
MADRWPDEIPSKAQVNDDEDVADDWETALDEKPKQSDVEEKPKTTTAAKSSKKKSEESQKTNKQAGSNTPQEELDQNKQKDEDEKSESADKAETVRSLNDLDLYKREEFLDYSQRLYTRLKSISTSEYYPEFIDQFLRGITEPMSIDDVKRLAASLQAITIRKQGDEREKKSKAKAKKQTKPQLRTGRQSDYVAFGNGDNDYDQDNDYDDEDFM